MRILKSSILFLFIIVISTSSYLDTQGKTNLNANQILVSPLGYYRLQFLSNCSLLVQAFNNQNFQYTNTSLIESNFTGQPSCSSLSLSLSIQGLVSNDGKIYRKPASNGQTYNRFVFGINDFGLVYLVFYWQSSGDNQIQYLVEYFQNINGIKLGPLINNLQSSMNYTNNNGWNFVNNNGYITISKQNQNNSVSHNIDLRGYQFKETGLVDPQGEIRYAAIPGMTFKPRAGATSSCGNPEGIFGQFDQYWPIFRVYDREKYLVAQYTINNLHQKICPEKMFELNGQCYASCPDPYYKQIRGKYGFCVLNCQTGSIIDDQKKICSSRGQQNSSNYNINTLMKIQCPNGSVTYQYGCICSSGLFFDFISNSCVSNCPQSTYGTKGICVPCPKNCKNCNKDPFKLTYLSCTECIEGYSGSQCLPNITCTLIQNCASCTIQNGFQNCLKCNPFYALSSSKLLCSYNCFSDEVLAIGHFGQGYCQKMDTSSPTTSDSFISGYYQGAPYLIRKTGTCSQGLYIYRDKCVTVCPQGMQISSDSRCICPNGMATFYNGTCQQMDSIQKNQLGYYYNSTYNSYLNCPIGCLKCLYNYCLKCQSSKYILVVSGFSSVCRQNTLHFTCNSEYYTYFNPQNSSNGGDNKLCISNKLLQSSTNITNCRVQVKNECIMCNDGLYLDYLGNCVSNCGQGYFVSGGICINNANIENSNGNNSCSIPVLTTIPTKTTIDSSVLNSPIYKAFTMNGKEISNEPNTQILTIRDQLGISTITPLIVTMHAPKVECRVKSIIKSWNVTNNVCADPSTPYQLMNKTCVANCPLGTKVYTPLSNDVMICMPLTPCFNQDKSTPYQLFNGTCVSSCPANNTPVVFGNGHLVQCVSQTQCQKNDTMTPFQISNKCVSSCPPGTSPILQDGNNLRCSNNTSAPPPINIDASVYTINNGANQTQRVFYFVVDKLLNLSDVKVNYYTSNKFMKVAQSSQSIAQSNVQLTQFNDKSYIAINTTAEEVILDFSKNIGEISSAKGNRLSSSIYGVRDSMDHIHNSKSWLAIIAYVLSLVLICLHAIYVGNDLLYKVDNWLIFAQSMYFFSFAHLLINASISQFYYGFLFAHFGFFPNYFKGTIPSNYLQGFFGTNNSTYNYVPNSYRLLTGDANFIRNAGFSFSLLLTFLAAFLVVVGFVFILKKCCGFYQIWYKRIAKRALIGAWEFVSMNIFYWAVAHLLYNRERLFNGVANQPAEHIAFRTSCSAAAIAWICIFGLYMIFRFVTDKIGGLYMFKRLVFAAILAASAHVNDNVYKLFLIPIVAAELIFMAIRWILQKPYLKRQKVFIILESFLMLVAYFTIYLWNDTGFVSIYVSIIIFIFIFLFSEDLMDVYLDNKDQFYDDNVKILPGLRHKQFDNGLQYEKLQAPYSHFDGPQTDRRLKTDRK